jgi:hypothetical protein
MPNSLPLTARQIAVSAAVGAALWLTGVIVIRLGFSIDLWQAGWPLALLYAVTIPISVPPLLLLIRAAGLGPDLLLAGLGVGTTVALAMDGIALVWFPAFYGPPGADLGPPAAWLLWAVSAQVLVALVYLRGR